MVAPRHLRTVSPPSPSGVVAPEAVACVPHVAQAAYKAATNHADSNLAPTHPIRLGLALNYSVFLYEVCPSTPCIAHRSHASGPPAGSVMGGGTGGQGDRGRQRGVNGGTNEGACGGSEGLEASTDGGLLMLQPRLTQPQRSHPSPPPEAPARPSTPPACWPSAWAFRRCCCRWTSPNPYPDPNPLS